MIAFVLSSGSPLGSRTLWLANVRASLWAADGEVLAVYISNDASQGFVVCESPDATTSVLALQQGLPSDAFASLHAVAVTRVDNGQTATPE